MRWVLAIAAASALVGLIAAASAGAAFPGANGNISFSSNGAGAALDADIFVIDPSGTGRMPLTDDPGEDLYSSFSADGERIAFARDEDIWVMNADGSGQTQLTGGPNFDIQPGFSPDGQQIVFSRVVGGIGEIYVMGAGGENPTDLTNDPAHDSAPEFSPDGQHIVFARYDGTDYEIFVMDANGHNQTPLTNNDLDDFAPSYSPNGQRIVFSHYDGSDDDIAVMDANGANQAPLTDLPSDQFAPAFSPDGQRIVFASEIPPTGIAIVTMDADGHNQSPLTSGLDFDRQPDWQPLNPPACDVTGDAKQRSTKRVTVTVTCTNEDASLVVGGSLKTPKPKGAASKSKPVLLQPVGVHVEPNAPTTVAIAPGKKGKKLLKKAIKAGKKPKGTVTVTATDGLGASASDSFAVKLKPKKK